MPSDIIQAQYDELANVARRFGSQARANQELIDRLQRAMRPLEGGGWQGRGSTAFFNEMGGHVLPAMRRLVDALGQAQKVTLQIRTLIQEAERDAADPFRGEAVSGAMLGAGGVGALAGAGIMAVGVATPGPLSGFVDSIGQGLSAIGGWVSNAASGAWDWIQDHRNEVALGAAVVAAGVAIAVTGGAAAPIAVPIIAGALTAGGVTLGINAASPRYELMDGVIGNTISGAFIGYGVGTAGAALGALRAAATAATGTPWAASVAAATAQVTQLSQVAVPLTHAVTVAPSVFQLVSGIGMVASSGGADILLPESLEQPVRTIGTVAGVGASLANAGLAVGGNKLIQYAWTHPRIHPPGGSLVGGGNSALFQSHHLYPQKQLGALRFPKDLLDDTVILPSGSKVSYIPGVHSNYTTTLAKWAQTAGFSQMAPAQQLQFLQNFNSAFMRGLLTNAGGSLVNLGAWAGSLVSQAAK